MRSLLISIAPRRNGDLPDFRPVYRNSVSTRHYLFFSAFLGMITLSLAVVVSFLAVSTTSEARAPGTDDQVAVRTEKVEVFVKPAWEALGPSTIYLEAPLVLAQQELPVLPPPDGAKVPDILANASRSISPPPPQAPLGVPTITQTGPIENVNLTFYDCADQGFCGHMFNGEYVYEGVAACSWNLPLNTAFYIVGDPTQRIYVCKDRGLLDDTWVDIFWYHPEDGYDWQSYVGRYGTINIVYLPN